LDTKTQSPLPELKVGPSPGSNAAQSAKTSPSWARANLLLCGHPRFLRKLRERARAANGPKGIAALRSYSRSLKELGDVGKLDIHGDLEPAGAIEAAALERGERADAEGIDLCIGSILLFHPEIDPTRFTIG